MIIWETAKLLCLDVETTGLEPGKDRIIEVGAFWCEAGDLDAGIRLGQLVNPGMPIPVEASKIHGIIDEMVVGKPNLLLDVAPKLLLRIKAADAIVGHNWPFDRRMLEADIGLAFTDVIANKPILDALDLVRLESVGRFWKGKGRHKLENVALRMKIARRGDEHRASSDAELAMRVLYRFKDRLPAGLHEAEQLLATSHDAERERFAKWQQDNPRQETA